MALFARRPAATDLGTTIGAEASIGVTVEPSMSAIAMGSGDVPVVATPALLALVERAAVTAVEGRLAPGLTTVGSWVELEHMAPTPIGSRIRAHARLQSVEGRRLTFSFHVADRAGTIARGTHMRVVVDRARFEASAARRAQPR